MMLSGEPTISDVAPAVSDAGLDRRLRGVEGLESELACMRTRRFPLVGVTSDDDITSPGSLHSEDFLRRAAMLYIDSAMLRRQSFRTTGADSRGEDQNDHR